MVSPTEIIAAIEAAGFVLEGAKAVRSVKGSFYDNILLGGKEKIGEFPMRDRWGRFWQVKVRETGTRGKYLKFEACFDKDIEVKASVNGKYKPHKYIPISLEAWKLFGIYSQTKDSYLTNYVEDLLNELVCS
jgi:hypothetical protein